MNEFKHEDVFIAKMPRISLTEWNAFESRDVIAEKLRKGCKSHLEFVSVLYNQFCVQLSKSVLRLSGLPKDSTREIEISTTSLQL